MPKPLNKMQSLVSRTLARLTPNASSTNLSSAGASVSKAPAPTLLFASVDPKVDGEDCLHDCASCTVHYPAKFSIDEDDRLYGHVKGWSTHLVVATGKTDWVRDVADEKGSLMESVGRHGQELKNGKVMLSASNMPTPDGEVHGVGHERTRVLLLPAWKVVEDVGPRDVSELLEGVVAMAPTNTSPLVKEVNGHVNGHTNGEVIEKIEGDRRERDGLAMAGDENGDLPRIPKALVSRFTINPCGHQAIILMCSQKTRDARCGQSAPLLRKEFERHLRPLGLYRDLHDERPGGVGIYFISHVGGHKYSANVMVYRRKGRWKDGTNDGTSAEPLSDQAVQGIWLARVRPEDCENIVRYTVLQGKVVKPDKQLRGGFDREKGLMSW